MKLCHLERHPGLSVEVTLILRPGLQEGASHADVGGRGEHGGVFRAEGTGGPWNRNSLPVFQEYKEVVWLEGCKQGRE